MSTSFGPAFHDFAFAAERREAPRAHGLANTVRHKPCGLISDFECAVQLVGAHAFLAGAHQMERLEPLVQSDLAALHDRPHGYCEVLAAFLLGAAVHAGALGRVSMIAHATVRATGAIGPQEPF